MTETSVLQERLKEAEDALHKLNTGAHEVEVEYEGFKTKYSPIKRADLQRYVNSLKTQLGMPVAKMSRHVRF
jgi:hypothetical protein